MYLSIITLNVNGLNAPIKRHTVADWIIKQESTICCLQETDFRAKDTQTESEGMEKGYLMQRERTRKQCHTLRQNRLTQMP